MVLGLNRLKGVEIEKVLEVLCADQRCLLFDEEERRRSWVARRSFILRIPGRNPIREAIEKENRSAVVAAWHWLNANRLKMLSRMLCESPAFH